MNQLLDQDLKEHLPESMREVASVIGLPATLRLVERYGGFIQLYIPKDVQEGHPLALALGMEPAQALAAAYGGDYLKSIPKGASAIRAARDRALLRRIREGVSKADAAREYGLTERRVWQILADIRDSSPQQATLPGLHP